MHKLIVGMGLLVASVASAATVLSSDSARVGQPDVKPNTQSVGKVDVLNFDPEAPQAKEHDPLLTISLDHAIYQPREPVVVRVKLHRKDGTAVPGADIKAVTDDRKQARVTGPTADLDNTPGEHTVEVIADAVINGESVHRSATQTYIVATGLVRIKDVGTVARQGDAVIVPLILEVDQNGTYQVEATLVSQKTRVAYAIVSAQLRGPVDEVPLTFPVVDLVEPGPYLVRHVQVMRGGPDGPQTAAWTESVGKPFNK